MSSPEAPSRPAILGRFFWRDPNTQFLILAAAAGLLGGLGAIVFRFLTQQLHEAPHGLERHRPRRRDAPSLCPGAVAGHGRPRRRADRPVLFRRAGALGDLPHDRGRLARPPHRAPAAVARARGVLDRRHRVRRLGGPRRPDHPDRGRLRVGARPGMEAVSRADPHPDGLRDGRRRRGRVQHADRGDALRSRGRRRLVRHDALRPGGRRGRRLDPGRPLRARRRARLQDRALPSRVARGIRALHGDRCARRGGFGRLRAGAHARQAPLRRLEAAGLGGDGAGRSDRRRDRGRDAGGLRATASRRRTGSCTGIRRSSFFSSSVSRRRSPRRRPSAPAAWAACSLRPCWSARLWAGPSRRSCTRRCRISPRRSAATPSSAWAACWPA